MKRFVERSVAAIAVSGVGALAILLLLPGAVLAQAHPNPATPDSLRQIQTMEPRMGPPGTEVSLYTENIPLQARVVVGLGAIGTGFEELGTGDQGEFGEIGATVLVPETAGWERAVVFIIFNGNFAPTGLSDPFHVHRRRWPRPAHGHRRRRGKRMRHVRGPGRVSVHPRG